MDVFNYLWEFFRLAIDIYSTSNVVTAPPVFNICYHAVKVLANFIILLAVGLSFRMLHFWTIFWDCLRVYSGGIHNLRWNRIGFMVSS